MSRIYRIDILVRWSIPPLKTASNPKDGNVRNMMMMMTHRLKLE